MYDARRFCHGVRAVHTTKNKTNLNDFEFGIYEVAEKVVLSNAIKTRKSTKVPEINKLAFEFGFEQNENETAKNKHLHVCLPESVRPPYLTWAQSKSN